MIFTFFTFYYLCVVAPIIARVSPIGDPVRVREGEALTVELNVSANPQPNFYEWTHTRDDVQRIVMNDNRITVSLNSIVFNPTSRNDSGVYRLAANNSAGSSEYSFTLDVQRKSSCGFSVACIVACDDRCAFISRCYIVAK
jgi:subtilase family serine protease